MGNLNDMMRTLGLDLAYSSHMLTIALVMARLVPCITLCPFLGGKSTPAEIKMALILTMTIVVYPFVWRTLPHKTPDEPLLFIATMLREIFIGFTIGIVAEFTYAAVEMMGRAIDTARGSNMAEVMVPEMEGRSTPLGDIWYQYAICLMIAIGGHRVYIQSVALSFERFPLMTPIEWNSPGLVNYIETVMRAGGDVLVVAVGMAFPAMAATFIIDVVFGLLNRVAPQLNAYFMAMPVKALGGIILVFVSTSMMSTRMESVLAAGLAEINNAFVYFGH